MKVPAVSRTLGAVLFVLAGVSPWVYADETQGASDADRQRAAIDESRRIQTQRLNALAKDCEQKFAATRCLDEVHTERLSIEDKLNRQAAALDDAQRLERGRQQMARNRDRAAAHAEKLANRGSEPAPQAKTPKLATQPTAPARQGPPALEKKPTLSAQERSAHANDYQRKQADASAKRAEVAKRVKDAGVKKPSLPTPN